MGIEAQRKEFSAKTRFFTPSEIGNFKIGVLPAAVSETLKIGALPTAISVKEMLTGLLQMQGEKPTPQNLLLLNLMLDAGIPLTKENIESAFKAFKITRDTHQTLFLVQNNIPPTLKNANLLAAFTEGQSKIIERLGNAIEDIKQMPNGVPKDTLLKLLENLTAPRESGIFKGLIDTLEPFIAQAKTAENSTNQPIAQTAQQAPNEPTPEMPKEPPIFESTKKLASAYSNFEIAEDAAKEPPKATPPPMPTIQEPPNTPQTEPPKSSETNLPKQPSLPDIPSTQTAQMLERVEFSQEQTEAVSRLLQHSEGRTDTIQPSSQNKPDTPSPLDSLPNIKEAERYSIPLLKSTVQDIENFINNLREVLEIAKIIIPKTENSSFKSVQTLIEHLDFANQVKDQIFVQIPLHIGDHSFSATLHVNKDDTNKSEKNGIKTALVALDTANMGHFETYVRKNGRGIGCNFKLENEETEQLVLANIHLLDKKLKEYNYTLESFTFVSLLDKTQERAVERSEMGFNALV